MTTTRVFAVEIERMDDSIEIRATTSGHKVTTYLLNNPIDKNKGPDKWGPYWLLREVARVMESADRTARGADYLEDISRASC